MRIDVSKELEEPTAEEIVEATKQFISFAVRRDRVVQSLVEGMKAKGPDTLAAISVSTALLKAMPPLFISGKFMGLQVVQDPWVQGFVALLLTKEELEQKLAAETLRESAEENELTGEREGEAAASEDPAGV